MKLLDSQNRINELMSRFVAQVKGATAMRRTDINSTAETMLIPLLAEVYGYTSLKNLNITQDTDYPAVDLGDEVARTAIQVTSTSDSEKVKNTLRKFIKYRLYEEYDRLIIYILTEKQQSYLGSGYDEIIQDKFSFDKDEDIRDYRDVLQEISGFQIDKARRVEKILEDYFGAFEHDKQRMRQRGLYPFTKENIKIVGDFRSIFLRERTYGTSDTHYTIIDERLVDEVKSRIDKNHFFLIYGNSGRGKTFFVCTLMERAIDQYDVITYYSPHFHIGSVPEADLILDSVEEASATGKRSLYILDDAHLVRDQLKKALLLRVRENENLHLLLVSRYREENAIPCSYLDNELFNNFNKTAEQTLQRILEKFCMTNHIELTEQRENELKSEIEGSNLTFLTLLLQSWEKLLVHDPNVSFDIIRSNAYKDFLGFYEHGHSENWKYINHIVSALFQYEIRIYKRYLSPEFNTSLAKRGVEEYLADRMIHSRVVSEKDESRLYYVFLDFEKGEEQDMMKHASEFRFYLEAYGKNLQFGASYNLDRIGFTRLVLRDYISKGADYISKGAMNPQDMVARIVANASEAEKDTILQYLYEDPEVGPLLY